MDRTQIILGFVVPFALLTMITLALNEKTPKAMASVGWHVLSSVGWNG